MRCGNVVRCFAIKNNQRLTKNNSSILHSNVYYCNSLKRFNSSKVGLKEVFRNKNDFILSQLLDNSVTTLIKTRQHQNLSNLIIDSSKDVQLPDNIIKKSMYSFIENGKFDHFASVRKIYEQERKITEGNFKALISSCITRGDIDTALKFIDEMKQNNFQITRDIYIRLLKVVVSYAKRSGTQPTKLFRSILHSFFNNLAQLQIISKDSESHNPNLTSTMIDKSDHGSISDDDVEIQHLYFQFYSEISNYYANFLESQKLQNLLHEMKTKNVKFETNHLFNNYIYVQFQMMGMQGIKDAFDYLMNEFSFIVDQSTYHYLLQMNAEKGNVKNVNSILQSMSNSNIKPDKNTYFLLAKSYANIALFPQISEMFSKLKELTESSPSDTNETSESLSRKFISIYRHAAVVWQFNEFQNSILNDNNDFEKFLRRIDHNDNIDDYDDDYDD